MPNKPLTIDVAKNAIPSGSLDNWTPLGNTTVFIKAIITPPLTKNTNIGRLVSGIPTAFARVDLFKTALDHVAVRGMQRNDNNLVGYYSRLVDEWRGLIACMALDYAHISVRKIDMAYSDGNDITTTANVYEPKGAFGNMLLRRSNRWRDLSLPDNAVTAPYINVIKYKDQVVGATSPESLLFTSTGYRCKEADEQPWIDITTGKFIDPLKSAMSPTQLATLHAYIGHLLNGLTQAENYYQALDASERVDYKSIRAVLQSWQADVERRAENEGVDLTTGSIPPVSACFHGPFQNLFCYKDIFYGQEGEVSTQPGDKTNPVVFDPKDLLLDENANIAKLDLNIDISDIKNLPALVLTADIKGMPGEKAYFALPLSAQGLNVFGANVATLVGMAASNAAVKSTLKAIYDPNASKENLEVVLTLVTEANSKRELKKIYTSSGEIKNKDILLWPDFITPQWNRYYMYSELPHNGTTESYRAFPFVGERIKGGLFRIIVDDYNNPVLLSSGGSITVQKNLADAELLVQSNAAVANNPYRYEIYRSDKPFKGVRLLSPTGKEGGYLLVNYSSDQGSKLPRNWMQDGSGPQLKEVRLGIDFGSTNTSIAFSDISEPNEQGFEFVSHRVSLMGNEMDGKPIHPRENQVFFFYGGKAGIKSNAVKSVLTIHDNRRLPALKQGYTLKMRDEQEVIGGFPCFVDNLPFANSDAAKITLNYPNGVGEVTQIHNMKWEDSDAAKSHKSAFLRTLLLEVYANLFADGYVPVSLKWSYPSAMRGQLLYSYHDIWKGLNGILPVRKLSGQSYELNVSNCNEGSFTEEPGWGENDNMADSELTTSFDSGFGNSGSFSGSDNFGNGGFGSGYFSDGGSFEHSLENGGSTDSFGEAFNSDQKSGTADTEAPATEDFMPDDPAREIAYKIKQLYPDGDLKSNPSLSEAEAVANSVFRVVSQSRDTLTLCFDVGGSTTDISALFGLADSNGKQQMSMIKQNSIRFAAQRVSRAVSKFPEFQNVLSNICAKYNIQMVGLNYGKNTYSESTAPYFFDQIVNRLDNGQLVDLYENISANCPRLMCVNMYVTGLLMFYAGQIARKLVDDLLHNSAQEWSKSKPRVQITFAGKGSRLFQWLSVKGDKNSDRYYQGMFIRGYGGPAIMDRTLTPPLKIIIPELDSPEIKYEVSKGLAKGNTELHSPQNSLPTEIIGESGFMLTGNDHVNRRVEFTNSLTPAMLNEIGTRLFADPERRQTDMFTTFCSFFYSATNGLCGWAVNPNTLERACRGIDIVHYVQNLPEYRAAREEAKRSGRPFNFVAPLIILEGMKFYDDTLMTIL